MKISSLFVAILLCFSAFAEEPVKDSAFEIEYDTSEVLKGKAYWQKDGKLAYLENHTIFYKEGKRVKVKTVYSYPDGSKFADFVSDYTKHPYIPAYKFSDERFGRVEGVEWLDGKTIRLFGQKYSDSKMKSEKLSVPKVGFAGQGFNFYIVDHLEKISAAKKPVEVDFIIPLQQKSYPFRIKARGPAKDGQIRLRAEIDNWLFRMFAPNIDVIYDTQKNTLVEYKGPSNLLNKDKDIKPVVIKYDSTGISIKQARQDN